MTASRSCRDRRLAFSAILLLAVSPNAFAAEPKSGVESVLTPETIGFLHVRIQDVWDSPGLAFYRKMLASLGADEVKAFNGKFAPNPLQFETVTVVMPSVNVRMALPDGRPVGESMLWVVTTKKPIDRVDLVKSLGLEARTKSHRGSDYLFEESRWAGLIQLDATTLVVGSEDSIIRLIEQRESTKGTDSQLAKIFAGQASKHSAMLAVNPTALATPEILKGVPDALAPLLKASVAWAALELKKETHLSLNIEFATAEQMAAGEKAVEAVRTMAQGLIALGMREMQSEETKATKRPLMSLLDMPSHFTPMLGKAALKYLESTLKALTIETKENTLRIGANLSEFFPANADALAIMTFAAVADVGAGSYYFSYQYPGGPNEEIPYYIKEKFNRVSAALEAYQKDKGTFPPAAIYDKNGKPLLSWRVLILPYMEQRPGDLPQIGNGPFGYVEKSVGPVIKDAPDRQNLKTFEDLYKQFKLDEPWDSLNNKKLIERMPQMYRIDFAATNYRMQNNWKTGMQVFTGPGTLFPGQNAVSKGQVKDGLESTIAVVFRDDPLSAVPWTKPADIPFSADKRLPKLFSIPPGSQGGKPPAPKGVFVIMADGQSRKLPPDFDEKAFKGLVTIDGGESVKVPDPKTKTDSPKFEKK